MDRCSDVTIHQAKSIVAIGGVRLIREAKAVQRAIKPVSRSVAREDSARSVASVRGGREADDQQPCIQRTQAGNRPSPVLPVFESPDFYTRDFFPVLREARTKPAILNFVLGTAATFRQGPEGF